MLRLLVELERRFFSDVFVDEKECVLVDLVVWFHVVGGLQAHKQEKIIWIVALNLFEILIQLINSLKVLEIEGYTHRWIYVLVLTAAIAIAEICRSLLLEIRHTDSGLSHMGI